MIGILGGTGVTGSHVVAALKAKGGDFTCIVRDPDAAKIKLGDDINVVQGDLSDPTSLDSAMEGIDTLYMLCGHSPTLKVLELNGLAAAKRAGVSYIVKSSGSEKGISADSPSDIMKMHYEVENEVRVSGIKWAISRPNFFMSTLMGMTEPIAKMGKLITTLPPETTISMIHPADIGESVAELLTNQDRAGQEYFLTGPNITMGEVAKAISEAVGKEIEYMQVPPEAAKKAMEEKGMPDWLMAHMGAMMVLAERGDMAGETDWVQQLTGHAPRTLAEWLSSTKAAFGG
jgi:uncharacterized protein YbjT (DUF2867 family)